MSPKRIFLTGASGCVGHYLAEALIQETEHELYLLVRNPARLKINYQSRPGVHLLHGSMQEIERFSPLLRTINCAILTATAWGGSQEVYDVNVVKTIRLMNLLNLDVCEQVIYFSTESILNRQNHLLKEAGEIGTDYIRTKYLCYRQLSKLAITPKITTLFPTLVLGGDEQKPYSHVSSGIAEVARWIDLIRFLKPDGSFHFIHGRDIAQVVRHLVDHPPAPDQPRQMVLGNAPLTAEQAITEACDYMGKKIYFQMPLSPWLADLIIFLFRIQMAPWDRFLLRYRHFTHQNPVNPATFGLTPYCPTFTDALKISGVPPGKH